MANFLSPGNTAYHDDKTPEPIVQNHLTVEL